MTNHKTKLLEELTGRVKETLIASYNAGKQSEGNFSTVASLNFKRYLEDAFDIIEQEAIKEFLKKHKGSSVNYLLENWEGTK